ncbi:inositol monophosphatase [Crinalium epipsammum PCC 9333]|uniref:inositol-phosphate phosphatase n=1 Tax=Crinalium epipsammum PCC 9333 TaxID=1173022 RepID=K9VUC8_9CYAN|nr:inositol monophosphatase family protein [Crinalium epipsammum]AFZ11067.1 inositol monophosphatase [Crinalium epipsammum PCC 9333]
MGELKYLGEQRYEGLDEISAIARAIGWGASDILRSFYRGEPSTGNLNIQEKTGGPVTAADLAVNAYILEKLQASIGIEDFGYLTEETYQSQTSLPIDHSWVWIIDPLDGTRDFIDKTGEYAIHIALVHQGRPVLAVVAWPEAEKLFYAIKNGGTFEETRDGSTTQVQVSDRNSLADLTLVVSRTHRDQRFNQLLQQLPCQNQRAVGSVGCKVATIVEQKADVYISISGKSAPKDWDMAAPELILTEAGGKFTHVDGQPLKYNQGDVNQWGCLIASNGHCHEDLCDRIQQILAQIDQNA